MANILSYGRLDFSPIGDIADSITAMRERNRLKDAFAQAGGDYNKMVQNLLALGDIQGAAKATLIARSMRPDTLSPYEAGKLALERQRIETPEPKKIGSVIERIREKLVNGEALNKGEQKVYDDSTRKDMFADIFKPVPAGVGPVATPGTETPPESGNLAPLSFPPLANAESPADPRGAYLPEAGTPQGMNRQAAPDGTVITNGTSRLKKENGKWVPF